MEVDLTVVPRLQPSSSNGDRPLEVDGQTTLDFARAQGCQVAINASPFAPVQQAPGEPKDIVGLAITNAEQVSAPDSDYGAFVVYEDGTAGVVRAPIDPAALSSVRHAVGGFEPLLLDGREVASSSTHVRGRHPRTAIGVSADGKTIWLVVVDGRQRGFSEGVKLVELAEIVASLGASDALNLDGGGSTSLVVSRDGRHEVVNSPIHGHVPGQLRVVGNSLCIFAQGR